MTRDIGVLYVWLDQFIVYWLGCGDCLAYNLLCLTQLHHYIPYASLSLQQHLCTVAILVLIGLFITVAYLLLHPFKLFERFIGKLKFKKDLIISVTDVLNGPFKDGTSENSWDYQYFAGMHFAIQLVVMTFYYIPLELKQVTGILKLTVCSLYIFSILIFRPYKRN